MHKRLSTMKAAICTRYGTPQVIQIFEVAKPEPKSNQLLIRIVASTVNSGDVRTRSLGTTGILKFIMRLVLGWSKPRKAILGTVFSGIVEETGCQVFNFKKGDKVFGMTGFSFGTHAEYLVINENSHVLSMPTNASFEEATAIIFGGQTAIYYLNKAKIKERKKLKILIYGATGAVGSAAVQIAQYYRAEVTAVCSTEGKTMLGELGVNKIICYDKEDFTKQSEKYDIIFDAVGKTNKKVCSHLLYKKGKFLSVKSGYASETLDQLKLLKGFFEAGVLKAVIDKTFPLESIVEAHAYVDSGRKKGNVILHISPTS